MGGGARVGELRCFTKQFFPRRVNLAFEEVDGRGPVLVCNVSYGRGRLSLNVPARILQNFDNDTSSQVTLAE